MFTGIIESLGKVVSKEVEGTNTTFGVQSDISNQLSVDQSLSHNGVCLTVIDVQQDIHYVTAINETLEKSSFSDIELESLINLERAMKNNGRFDGHIVQGHVDGVATCTKVVSQDGSWIYKFELEAGHGGLMVEKGSICIDGISLTCFNVSSTSFDVAIIPYTYENTNFKTLSSHQVVNIEFDIIGKYVRQMVKS